MFSFKKGSISRHADAIVREIAERSAAATLSQLSTAAERMSLAELRGYVRAHAWPLVCTELLQSVSNERLPKTDSDELAGRALEQTVHLVTRAYIVAPIAATPTPHIWRRDAA